MGWMSVTFSAAEAAAGREEVLQEAFAKIWIGAGVPPEAVMYGSKSTRDNQCFFNPAAVELARHLLVSFDAVECLEPDPRNLIVLVRNEGAPVRPMHQVKS